MCCNQWYLHCVSRLTLRVHMSIRKHAKFHRAFKNVGPSMKLDENLEFLCQIAFAICSHRRLRNAGLLLSGFLGVVSQCWLTILMSGCHQRSSREIVIVLCLKSQGAFKRDWIVLLTLVSLQDSYEQELSIESYQYKIFVNPVVSLTMEV